MKDSGIKLKLILPHFLSSKWKIKEVAIKNFIKTYGYWAWEQSTPALKVYINDNNIMGEQESFFIRLNEGDYECVFFVPYDNKKYKVEFGRFVNENLFIPLSYSDYILHPHNKCYSVFPLSSDFIKNIEYDKLMESLEFS